MKYAKLILLILMPAMLLGQDNQLSEAARELLNQPRLGSAQLTWSDGRKEDGRVVRVTDQFVTFDANRKPSTCENVELSKIEAVQWQSSSENLGSAVLLGAVLSPFYMGSAVADPFHRMFPPLRPLRGIWESIRRSNNGVKSSLYFDGSTVQSREVTVKRGRYHAERDRLYMMFDGGPETVVQFHFKCRELILDSPSVTYMSVRDTPHRVFAPIVGEWQRSGSVLYLRPSGSFEERKEELRKGAFEMTATGVRIHWADSQGPGGEEWSAQIKHRHVVARVGGVTKEYRYVPPGFTPDM
jgi:hypothetical protein